MIQISAAMLPHGVPQFLLDHVHHLTLHGVLLSIAKFVLKSVAKRVLLSLAKSLLVRLVPAHLLAKFAPTWLPPAKLPPAETAVARKEPERC